MVGSGTVIADNPRLSARDGDTFANHQPLRIILDGRGRLSPGSLAFGPGAIVATSSSNAAWRSQVAATGATVLDLEHDNAGLNFDQLFRVLGQRNVMSLIAEGGPTVLQPLFEDDHVDEVHAYVAPRLLGEAGIPLMPRAATFDPSQLREVAIEQLAPDVLIRGYTGSWSPAEA
jgi:diaminohydroxyphosphoribosylaminopyrimidine deaminase/5-amino-6-(5-phosphoribosylamino)uracil reductase